MKSSACACLMAILSLISFVPSAFALKVDKHVVSFDAAGDFALCSNRYPLVDCLKALDVWLKTHPKDAMAAAKDVRKNSNAVNALPYLQLAFAQKQGDCTDTEALDVAVAGLQLPAREVNVAIAKKLAFTTCFKDWKEDLAKNVEDKNSYYLVNACPELVKAKALSPDQKTICEQK